MEEKMKIPPIAACGRRPYVRPTMEVVPLDVQPLLGGSKLNGGHNPTNLFDVIDTGFGGGGGTTTGGSSPGSGHWAADTDDYYEGAVGTFSVIPSSTSSSAPSSRRVPVSPLGHLIYGTAVLDDESSALGDYEGLGNGYYSVQTDSITTDPTTSLLQTP